VSFEVEAKAVIKLKCGAQIDITPAFLPLMEL